MAANASCAPRPTADTRGIRPSTTKMFSHLAPGSKKSGSAPSTLGALHAFRAQGSCLTDGIHAVVIEAHQTERKRNAQVVSATSPPCLRTGGRWQEGERHQRRRLRARCDDTISRCGNAPLPELLGFLPALEQVKQNLTLVQLTLEFSPSLQIVSTLTVAFFMFWCPTQPWCLLPVFGSFHSTSLKKLFSLRTWISVLFLMYLFFDFEEG